MEGPTLSGSIGSPGVVDQPAWELKGCDDEVTEHADDLKGLVMEEWSHG